MSQQVSSKRHTLSFSLPVNQLFYPIIHRNYITLTDWIYELLQLIRFHRLLDYPGMYMFTFYVIYMYMFKKYVLFCMNVIFR